MHFSTFVPFLAVAVAFSQAASVPKSYVVHEKRDSINSKWTKRNRLDTREVLPVRIGLKQSNLHKGADLLMDISRPDSPNYGKHYTAKQIAELFKPSEETVTAVKGWLTSSGVHAQRITISSGSGWINFDATTGEVEKLLRTEFYQYEHTITGEATVGNEQYHLPEKIQEHVDFIMPGIMIGVPMKASRKRSPEKLKRDATFNPHYGQSHDGGTRAGGLEGNTQDCDKTITPPCISGIYNIPPGTLADASNAMGIFEFGSKYSTADLDQFFKKYASNIPEGTHPTGRLVDGAVAPVAQNNSGGEAALDFELTYPIVYPQGTVLFQSDDEFWTSIMTFHSGFFNTFLDAIDGTYCNKSSHGETGDAIIDPQYPDPFGYDSPRQCGVYEPTNVISISYGFAEADPPINYQQRQCEEFMKLGLRGTTVVVSSGDNGVAQRPFDGGEGGCLGTNGTVFSPSFPVSCPYVTSVGATTILPGNTLHDPESAVTNFGSGGGFSNIYDAPSYQAGAIGEFFGSHDPPYPYYRGGANIGQNGGLYNRDGRGIPDVAALGENIAVVWRGMDFILDGTSASAPIFASIINRINEERIAVGKKTVGFVNPALYGNPTMFNDITLGDNPGCNTNGFAAVPGWDPVTGLGTPDYTTMLDYFKNLP